MEKPEDFEDASVASIMRHIGCTREQALEQFRAIDEAQRVFNAAKKLDRKHVTVTRRTLFRLLMGHAALLGMDLGPPKAEGSKG